MPSAASAAGAIKRREATGFLTIRRRRKMKKAIIAALFTVAMAGTSHAQNIGVSMALFDDNFLTVLRNGMQSHAKTLDGVKLQVEDAQNDVGRQLNQIQNFIASGINAIIVNPVDTDATTAMSKLAEDAKIPLVYVNRQPVNLDKLPKNQAFVASNEVDSGTLETKEVCRLLKEAGKKTANVLVMMGELSNQAGRQRTKDIHDVIATPECSFMKIVEEQTGNWKRTEGQDLMTNWISASVKFDAVISNNDEMALGAIQALKAAKVNMKDVVVGGIDATQDALAAMQAGDLDVTVFQDAAGQGKGAVQTAVKLAKNQPAEQKTWVPFQLVTPANMANFGKKN
jgi:ABC-type sugar transport system substrate-binding protein